MLDLNSIAVDPALASDGVWCEYMGGKFLLARKGPAYHARVSELYQERKDEVEKGGEKGGEALLFCYRRAFCETILKGWENVGRGGKKVKYSPDAAMEILTDPRMVELLQHLELFSLQHSNYQEATVAEVAKSVKPTAAS